MTRLLCPACGARVRETSDVEKRTSWNNNVKLYRCTNGHETDYPRNGTDSRTIKRWCREEDAESVQYGPDSVPSGPST